jgi:hypothetical protein
MLLYQLSKIRCGRQKVSPPPGEVGNNEVEAIVQAISDHARVLLQKWGQENAPPPADIYSLDNVQGSGLHVIQKTFQGDFEVIPLTSLLTPSSTSFTTPNPHPRKYHVPPSILTPFLTSQPP